MRTAAAGSRLSPLRNRAPHLAAALAAGALAFTLALALPSGPAASVAGASASGPPPAATLELTQPRLRQLRAAEQTLRAALEPARQPPWLDASGADPYRIVAAPAGSPLVGLLRGARALVTLDGELRELSRTPLPEAPTALCLRSEAEALVASRYAAQLWRVRLGPGSPSAQAWRIDPRADLADGVADVACGSNGLVYALPAGRGDLLTLDAKGKVLARRPALGGGLRLQRLERYLLESSLFERSLRALELDERGVPVREVARIRHDGPIWAFDALERGGELWLVLAGVEDRPLVRAHGEFENIDSFLWVYRLSAAGRLERVAELDVSGLGLVVPRVLKLRAEGGQLGLEVLAAGSGARLVGRIEPGGVVTQVQVEPAFPGAADAVLGPDGALIYASPLFDAWVSLRSGRRRLVPVDPETRPPLDVRLGEALFFSELIAPDNPSLGGHSRFSCETCHFEGGVDGRTHYTGRGNVSVVTKPLFGLANNRPHFSRALDPDLSAVSHNEFRVAGAGSGRDPWFDLETRRFPWLRELGIDRAELDPLELRRALATFLYAFSHAPSARTRGRARFDAIEAAGARAFQRSCAGCHAARSFSDRAASEVPFDAWEAMIFRRNAPIVWARGDYARTGIEPYVHERGTRIPSLRRLVLKPRFFTNGSARSLAQVLEDFREDPAGARHRPTDEAPPLPAEEQRALLAFLRLL